MPNLVGWDLNELGDGGGVLFPLQSLIGIQVTTWVAFDDAPVGVVVTQFPSPGTALAGIENWNLAVSEGGPSVAFEQLPDEVAAFAKTLPGFEVEEALVERTTEFGTVYKTDAWLFGLDCSAVDAAYRTFADGRYENACPGAVGLEPTG